MAEAVIMPKTGMAMEHGTIIEWLVREGDQVSIGDPIVEIETDKSSMEVESDCEGTVLSLLYDEGSTVPVVQPIAWIGMPGESPPGGNPPGGGETEGEELPSYPGDTPTSPREKITQKPTPEGKVKATPAARRAAAGKGLSLQNIQATGRHGEIRLADVSSQTIKITPLAKRMAEAENINLNQVQGSGHNGKITSADITTKPADVQRIPLSGIQQITGKRMLQSHREIPDVSMDSRADVTELITMRKRLNESLENPITINDFVMKAATMALRETPRINSVLDGDGIICHPSINLGMAVATDKGLLVPVIRNVDGLTLRDFSMLAADAARKAREGRLEIRDMEGGTFTVSNVGMFGITSFTPIINPPQAGILGVCAIEEKLCMRGEKVEVRQIMGLSLSFDHRIIDGVGAAIFISRIRELLENPLTILA